ncbi:MAG TPA: serine/threonine-protein kinase [Kofleriaceae bacterium]|nr:serine/threonine-protein kinase [Kofleriaceae bacterium]
MPSPSDNSPGIAPGIVIDRYRIDGVVGAGSMGDVYLAQDLDLSRMVALKILSERHRDNAELRARFVREARAVAAIAHPNVVQVFTTGSFDDRPYIAMEFLDGVDLGTDVRDNGPWTSVRAARALRDAAMGLDGAARAGLIHRDVKPSNLVLLHTGAVKVTDFGLAKPLDPGGEPALTALGVVVGTPDYIAPEQARGDAIDERVDIYALGGTLYFLLTGIPPFRTGKKGEDKYLKVVARHLRDPAPDPRKRAPRADPELSALTMRLMAKKPAQRPHYPELLATLETIIARLQEGRPESARAISHNGLGGEVGRTPFVGGVGPRPSDFDGGRTHGPDDHDALDAAPTNLRVPTLPPSDGAPAQPGGAYPGAPAETQAVDSRDIAVARPRPAGWLIVLTVLSALVFLTGLALVLFGPLPEPEAAANARADASGSPAIDAPLAALPEPPEGMLLVRRADGTPWCFVSRRPVSWAEYRAMFPRAKPPAGAADTAPVTNVEYRYAVELANARDARLPTSEEWTAAARTDDFVAAGAGLSEWVDTGIAPGSGPQQVRADPAGDSAARAPKGHKDVTFRLAQSL